MRLIADLPLAASKGLTHALRTADTGIVYPRAIRTRGVESVDCDRRRRHSRTRDRARAANRHRHRAARAPIRGAGTRSVLAARPTSTTWVGTWAETSIGDAPYFKATVFADERMTRRVVPLDQQ